MLSYQTDALKQRFPNFEPSYETVIHKNVPDTYNLAVAVPVGRKSYAWFTFLKDTDALYVMDLDKDKRIVKTTLNASNFSNPLATGTILYGLVIPETNVFIIEDVYYYKGIPMQGLTFGEKLHYIHQFLTHPIPGNLKFALPVMWYGKQFECESMYDIQFPYQVHHVQFRSLQTIVPFLNYSMSRKPGLEKDKEKEITRDKDNNIRVEYKPVAFDFTKPQYRQSTVFHVMADMKFDIYHLFARDVNDTLAYYNTAYIPSYKTSIFMNGLFRNIKENANLDYIEESDDEADFENIKEDRFVDLQKVVYLECVFNHKFKRWTPMRVMNDKSRVISIAKLVK
jgi:hypothetical protein